MPLHNQNYEKLLNTYYIHITYTMNDYTASLFFYIMKTALLHILRRVPIPTLPRTPASSTSLSPVAHQLKNPS